MDDSGQAPSLDSHGNTKTAEPDYSLLSGANATFIAEMKAVWVRDPNSVDKSWAAYFKHLDQVGAETDLMEAGPSWGTFGEAWASLGKQGELGNHWGNKGSLGKARETVGEARGA